MTEEASWPARNVAEFAYCPRLFYLMEVEGFFAPSADTEAGVGLHQRADRPSVRRKERRGRGSAGDAPDASAGDGDRPLVVRSLALSSLELSLSGRLDLVEFDGKRAVPIEYRKGHPKLSPDPNPGRASRRKAPVAEPWPTDVVQVGLQALLLRDAGYIVERAILYYAETRRRIEVAVGPEVVDQALDTLARAKECARGPRPLPLLNDPRCPRCSLEPICLPDEVNHVLQGDSETNRTPRKLWPPRDEGVHLVVQTAGAKVGVRGETIRVSEPGGVDPAEIPLVNVESVTVLGSAQVTTQAVHVLAERGVPIAFLSGGGRLVAMVDPNYAVSAAVRRAQARLLEDEDRRVELARALIGAKITNQRRLLMRNNPGLPATVAREMARAGREAARADSLDVVRGHEGQGAALYFGHLAGALKEPFASEFASIGRERRPPPDPVNACLSLGYSMLTHECVAALRLASLEPSLGAFHSSRPGRPALALDLMEPFRPLIADSIALQGLNRGELQEGHFLRTSAGTTLTREGRQAFFSLYGRRMDTTVTHPEFGYRLSYRRMLGLHARMIAAWMLGEVPSLVFLTTR